MAGLIFRIEVRGQKELLKKINFLRSFFRSTALRTVLEDAKNFMVRMAIQRAPKDTFSLSQSIDGVVKGFGSTNVNIRIGTPKRYAIFQEFGTTRKNYPIRPVNKKALFWTSEGTFTGPRGGERQATVFTFASKVTHPGFKAQPFLRPALQEAKPRLIQALERILNEHLSGAR